MTLFWHCPYRMLCRAYTSSSNSTDFSSSSSRAYVTVGCPSVRPSVCLSHHSFAARRYDGFLLCARPAENIGRLRHGRRPAASAPQHGTQQQTRAVSRLQLTQEAEHGLVLLTCDRLKGVHVTVSFWALVIIYSCIFRLVAVMIAEIVRDTLPDSRLQKRCFILHGTSLLLFAPN